MSYTIESVLLCATRDINFNAIIVDFHGDLSGCPSRLYR